MYFIYTKQMSTLESVHGAHTFILDSYSLFNNSMFPNLLSKRNRLEKYVLLSQKWTWSSVPYNSGFFLLYGIMRIQIIYILIDFNLYFSIYAFLFLQIIFKYLLSDVCSIVFRVTIKLFTSLSYLQLTDHAVGEVLTVTDLHARKAEMARRADAFIALPGLDIP